MPVKDPQSYSQRSLVCLNQPLRDDLGIKYVKDVTRQKSKFHNNKLEFHTNPLKQPLMLDQANRRLKRQWLQVGYQDVSLEKSHF